MQSNDVLSGDKAPGVALKTGSQASAEGQCSAKGSGIMCLPCAEGRWKEHRPPLLIFTLELLTVDFGAKAWEDPAVLLES